MKKIFFILLTLCIQIIESCPRCLGYTGRRLRRHAMEKVSCNCNCERQYHIRYDDKQGYTCIRCRHHLLPDNSIDENTTRKPSKN